MITRTTCPECGLDEACTPPWRPAPECSFCGHAGAAREVADAPG